MRKLNTLLFVIFIGLFLIININYISAQVCSVEARQDCVDSNIPGAQIVMGLSSSTNAHGELASQSNYNTVLCCQGIGTGDTSCAGNNKVLGLSSSTNAHAERPEGTTYTNNVCYDGLNDCFNGPPSVGDGEISVITLSATTNAHLGTDYSTEISCVAVSSSPTCDLQSATWNDADGEVFNGTPVDMIVGGTSACVGQQISFEVLRDSTSCADIEGCSPPANVNFGSTGATGTWTAGPAHGTRYSFVATVVGTSESQTSSTPNLLVNSQPAYCSEPPFSEPEATCSDYTIPEDCNANACSIDIQLSISDPNVDCSSGEWDCYCEWNTAGSICEGVADDVEVGGAICGNGIRETGETCDAGDIGAFACTSFGFSGGDLGCRSDCQGFVYTGCTGFSCNNNGIVNLGSESCDGTNFTKSDGSSWSCSDFDEFISGNLGCSSCEITTNECVAPEETSTNAGRCIYTQSTTDNCDDGFLSFSWTGRWDWDDDCTVANGCQGIPENIAKKNSCEAGGSATRECPAQIALPFFSFFNVVITLLMISLIYYMMFLRKKQR